MFLLTNTTEQGTTNSLCLNFVSFGKGWWLFSFNFNYFNYSISLDLELEYGVMHKQQPCVDFCCKEHDLFL